jgi:hypothetical protein
MAWMSAGFDSPWVHKVRFTKQALRTIFERVPLTPIFTDFMPPLLLLLCALFMALVLSVSDVSKKKARVRWSSDHKGIDFASIPDPVELPCPAISKEFGSPLRAFILSKDICSVRNASEPSRLRPHYPFDCAAPPFRKILLFVR